MNSGSSAMLVVYNAGEGVRLIPGWRAFMPRDCAKLAATMGAP
jgi:hypothetical protein